MADIFLIVLLTLTVFFAVGIFLLELRKGKTDQAQSGAIRDLERRLTDLMMGQLKEIRDSQEGSSKTMHERIASFTREATRIRGDLEQVQAVVKNVSSFQEIFRSPKLRGQWGEASLEHLLAQHFPNELYATQHLFASGEQVDAVLKLPNRRLLPIDAKFPFENFGKMIEAESPEKHRELEKRFIGDVKARINEITNKYILPSEGTVDFALMYIPAEAIYYEIINRIGRGTDLASYAWSKKVILTSPNTIYLTLRTIEHWFRDTQISRKTQEILKRLGRIHLDAEKLGNSFRKLGSHLQNAVSAYGNSEKRLELFSQRVDKLLETRKTKKLKAGPLPEKSNPKQSNV